VSLFDVRPSRQPVAISGDQNRGFLAMVTKRVTVAKKKASRFELTF
jgi:hypothetical protein